MFSRVNPAGWGVGDKLKSTQMNPLDIDHANALDKTTAGDTLSGAIAMASTAAINANFGGNIAANVPGAIVGAAAGSLASVVPGGVGLAGGDTDWPAFYNSSNLALPAPRERVLWVPGDRCIGVSYNIGGAAATTVNLGITSAPFVVDGAGGAGPYILNGFFETSIVNSGGAPRYAYYLPLTQLHNGATLSAASLYMVGATSHTSLPANMPAVSLYRAGAGGIASLVSGTPYTLDPTSVLATYKTTHQIPVTTNQNNVIDTTQYSYFALIYDESGANAEAFNTYYGMALLYVGINDMHFP